MGSTEAARRAGTMEAASASRKMEMAAKAMTVGSSGSTSKSMERSRRVAKIAATAPMPQPARPSLAADERTNPITLERCEPSARRMAISWVRSAAEKAMTL